MEVFEAVRTVLADREYLDKPIPPTTVHRIAEAAHLTASSMNAQPWHFVFVQDRETIRRIAAVNTHGAYAAVAPLVVVVAYDSDSRYGVSDVSRAIQSMVLTAWAEGVGSNWTGWSWLEAVNPIVGLPADKTVLAVVPFGYTARRRSGRRKNRKPFADVISGERFGQPLR